MPIAEQQWIRRLTKRSDRRRPGVALGIGDDCALLHLPGGHEALVTTDFSLEGVHFRRDWQSPECIGHKCLARGLSDIAAMGGRPLAAFLSVAFPPELPQHWADRFLDGLLRLARLHRVKLAGGDTAQSPAGVLADIVVLGSVSSGTSLRRSGARAGDRVYVTGELGESAAVLQLLTAGKIKRRDVYPQPRIGVGKWLRENRIASSAIDISDGLSTDLAHICEESGVGATVYGEVIPIHSLARKAHRTERRMPPSGSLGLELALHGGEDYELLFTAPKSKRLPNRIAGVKITKIGEILRGSNMGLVLNGTRRALRPKGWEHFRRL